MLFRCFARPAPSVCFARSVPPSVLSLYRIPTRCYAVPAAGDAPVDLAHTRNIGIIAHIDAGKTTTTERMLYYAGFTRRIGDVDEGSTVMDYLPAERARGITITSACITLHWTPSTPSGSLPYTINLIDTPGHADFTFEVERSIRVLDGAVTILDGVAGVEAQTEKVWRQAGKYSIPRIIFVNKLDRVGARFGATIREIAIKLGGWPAVLQLPIYENDGKGGEDVFRGVVDVVEKRVFMWDLGGDGQKIELHDYQWLQKARPELYMEALAARVALVELLSEHDEDLVETFLELGDHQAISASSIKSALRKVTLKGDGKVIPVLCGASFKNVGVQPLLDAVIDYLPSPLDRPDTEISYSGSSGRSVLKPSEDKLCALAFKVVYDPKRGAMVYVRVYSGALTRSTHLHNTNLNIKEKSHRLLRMYANEATDIDSIPTGHIGVIIGLKHTRTGDTLVSESISGVAHHQKHKQKHPHHHNQSSTPSENLQLRPIEVPPPVFFASLEPNSLAETKGLEEALAMLLREDPSLHISVDEDSGQTLLAGMGELHLEIARDRLVGDLKAKAEMGKILIGYRETVTAPSGGSPLVEHKVYEREVGGKHIQAGCNACVSVITPHNNNNNNSTTSMGAITSSEIEVDCETTFQDGNVITTILTPVPSKTSLLPSHLPRDSLHVALKSGALAALSRGPYLSFPLHSTHIQVSLDLSKDLYSTASTLGAVSSAARLAAAAALKSTLTENGEGVLMEPVMDVGVVVDESVLGKVVGDIVSQRGGHVVSLDSSSTTDEAGEEIEETQVDLRKIWIPSAGNAADNNTRAVGGGGGGGEGDQGEGRGGGGGGRTRTVKAVVPLKAMVGYLRHLRSLTGGRGTFVMELKGFENVSAMRTREVIKEIRGG